jgi:hypothetical protein
LLASEIDQVRPLASSGARDLGMNDMRVELLAALATGRAPDDACRQALSEGAGFHVSNDAYSARRVADIWEQRVERLADRGIPMLGPDLPERVRSGGYERLRSVEIRGREHTFVLFLAPEQQALQVVGSVGFPRGLNLDSGDIDKGGAQQHPYVPPPESLDTDPFRQPTLTRAIRNGHNWLAGWLFVLGLPAFVLFFDPLFLRDQQYKEGEDLATLVLLTLGFAVASLMACICLLRPTAEVTPQYFILRNPLRETAVPRAGASLAHGMVMGYPKLIAADGSGHVAWGAENSAPVFLQHLQPRTGEALPVATRRRKLGRPVPTMAALWGLYCLAGVVRW